MTNISKKAKTTGIVITFIIITIMILFIFRMLDKRLNKRKFTINNTLDFINWADDRTIGFQPRLIEEYLENKEEIGNLIKDLNKVLENGEKPEIQKIQQDIILNIHTHGSNMKNLENAINNNPLVAGKSIFKEKWYEEDTGYSLVKTIDPSTLLYFPNRSNNYTSSEGHHNRLKPSEINNYLANNDNWQENFSKDNIGNRTNIKKRILYTNNKIDLENDTSSLLTHMYGKLLGNYDENNLPDMSLKQLVTLNEEYFFKKGDKINSESNSFKNLWSSYFEELNESTINVNGVVVEPSDKLNNINFEPPDPYFRILYKWPGVLSSINNDVNWPFSTDTLTNPKTGNARVYGVLAAPRGRSNEQTLISLNKYKKGKTFDTTNNKATFGFLQDPEVRDIPIWPLNLPGTENPGEKSEFLHKSKGPILKKNKGSFETKTVNFKNIGNFIEYNFLTLILGKITNHKKIFITFSIIYIVTSIFIIMYIKKKTQKKKGEDNNTYKNRVGKYDKIKKVLFVGFPISYYIILLFTIVSIMRFRFGKLSSNKEFIDIELMLKNGENNIGRWLYTEEHLEILKNKLTNITNGKIPNMNAVSYISSGIIILIVSIILFFFLKFIKKFPIESKLASIILLFTIVVFGSSYLFYKNRNFLYLFKMDNINIFGTTNKFQILITVGILLFSVSLYLLLINSNKINVRFSTNGNTLLEKETTLSKTLTLTNINSDLYSFSISSWFYFVTSNTDKDIVFFNFNGFPTISFNPYKNVLTVNCELCAGVNNIIYSGSIKFQKWNNFIINYNGSNIDFFINNKLVGTTKFTGFNKDTDQIYQELVVGTPNTPNICLKKCDKSGSDIKNKCYINNKVVCGVDNCVDTKSIDCSTDTNNGVLNGGMAKIVFYDNILTDNEIRKNYSLFKNTLKNKVY